MKLSKKMKEDIIRIFLLCKETKLSYSKILSIFPEYTAKDIENIDKGKDYKYITSNIELDTEYIVELHKTKRDKPALPLGRTYVKEIYYLAKSETMSNYMISDLFNVSSKSIYNIKLHTPEIYMKYIKNMEIKNKNNKKVRKKPMFLTDLQKREIVLKAKDINEGKISIMELSSIYNVHSVTIKNLLRKYNIKTNTKFTPNKLTDQQVINIFLEGESGNFTRSEIASRYNVNERTICSIKNGRSHKKLLFKHNLISEM